MKRIALMVMFLVLIAVSYAGAYDYVSTASSTAGTTSVVTCASVSQQVVPAQTARVNMGMVNNDSSKTVYWGYTSAVTVATGIPLYPHSTIIKDRTRKAIYCITSGSDTVNLRYWYE